MKIKLVEDGIFPITKNKDGVALTKQTDTGFLCAGTIQGEGKLLGTSCLFIRLSKCNLRCIFELWDGSLSLCDTAYSSHNPKYFTEWDIEDVIQTIDKNIGYLQHIVISGGEPTMQEKELVELVELLKMYFPELHITLETNGTHFIKGAAKYIDLYSISPKLIDSVPTESKLLCLGLTNDEDFKNHDVNRKRYDEIQKYVNMCYNNGLFGKTRNHTHDFQLKFVVTNVSVESEIYEILNSLKGVKQTDVYLMPAGGNTKLLKKTTPVALEMAIRNGWQFSPRIHIDLFGNKRGV